VKWDKRGQGLDEIAREQIISNNGKCMTMSIIINEEVMNNRTNVHGVDAVIMATTDIINGVARLG
jgi:hypothetical protein